MVDSSSRTKARHLLERLFSGEVTNFELDDNKIETADPSISAIYARLWCFYSDFPKEKLDQQSFSQDQRVIIERCILFLGSSLEYQWPEFDFRTDGLAGWRTLFSSQKTKDRVWNEFISHGHFDCWPFLSHEAYEQEVAKQGRH